MWKLFPWKRKQALSIRINGGETLDIGPDETVLEAALRAGLPAPHLCRVGACRTCICKVTAGNAKSLIDRSYVLNDQELEQDCHLACQTLARSDLELEWVMSARARSATANIVARQALTPRVWRITLELEGDFPMRAGQYISLKRSSGQASWVRPYSVVSCRKAERQTLIEIDVARHPAGLASTWMTSDESLAGSGDASCMLLVEGPFGNCHADGGDAPLITLGAGSGIGAAYGVLAETSQGDTSRSAALLAFGREASDIYGLDLPTGSAMRHAHAWVEAPSTPSDEIARFSRGRVSDGLAQHLQGLASAGIFAGAPADWQYLLFGPPGFVDASLAQLRALGVSHHNIRFDRYTASPSADGPAWDQRADRPTTLETLET